MKKVLIGLSVVMAGTSLAMDSETFIQMLGFGNEETTIASYLEGKDPYTQATDLYRALSTARFFGMLAQCNCLVDPFVAKVASLGDDVQSRFCQGVDHSAADDIFSLDYLGDRLLNRDFDTLRIVLAMLDPQSRKSQDVQRGISAHIGY